MMELTKERIELFIKRPLDNGLTRGEQMEMARQLLAGLEQEPVGITDRSEIEGLKRGEMANVMPPDFKGVDEGDKVLLYAAPQLPQPVEPEITSEELDNELLEQLIDFRRDTLSYHKKEGNKVQTVMHGVVLRAMLELQELRAAMLQGAEPVQGWIACSERMPDRMVDVITSNGVEIGKGWWDGYSWKEWHKYDAVPGKITHWMPLPNPPQE
ncbi:DUF551 domain-containing protein [Leclercia sp. J807]|uniref:DUF551 domain-containing protein n=1 Tax=Leclercia sp. J807 TaxID=2681307 RepID=UPI0018CD0B58|nr:DUF551 domain-containing protein [Leclercia sp. J807]